jgi:hypothetical protein
MTRRTIGLLLLSCLFAIGAQSYASAAPANFSPNAHRAALLKLLDTYPGSPGHINRFRITPSSVNATWVHYVIGISVSDGGSGTVEDWADGYAHYLGGRWINVVGPGSGLCLVPAQMKKIPVIIRRGFGLNC